MKKLLFISTYPFPLDMGANQHAYFFIEALSRLFEIYCVFFLPPHKNLPENHKKMISKLKIRDHKICYYNSFLNENKYLRFIKQIIAFPGYYVKLATNSNALRTINKWIQMHSIEFVHFEHFHYTRYAFSINNATKKIIVYHDLHHSIYRQRMHIEKKLSRKFLNFSAFVKFYFFEKMLDKIVNAKFFLNALEMQSLPKNAFHIPHFFNPNIKFRKVRKTEFFNILFLGTYNHPPNRLSVQYIFKKILPELVSKKQNNFRLHIVGPDTEKFGTMLGHKSYKNFVTIHGFIKDINQIFIDMDIALFPILYGGGIKTKVIDAMAAGIPVITTPEGIAGLIGLPGNIVGVCKSVNDIIRQLDKLMNNYSLRLERSHLGKDFVEKQHSFKTFAKKIEEAYQRI